MMDKFKSAFRWQKANASNRGIEFLFNFDEWKDWWISTKKWDLRGVGKDKYCMCRFGDVGPYAIWNVYCATNSKNLSDANKGKPKSIDIKLKMSIAATGKAHDYAKGSNNVMHRPEVKEKISAAIGGDKHYRHKGVVTPDGYFVTTKAASEALNIPKSTIEWRCRNQKHGFSYKSA